MIYTVTLNPALDRTVTVKELTINQILHAESTRLDFGGKGFNVSRALKLLGQSNTAIGFLGGMAGELMRAGLIQLGIDIKGIPITGETRTNVVIKDHSNTGFIKVNEPGPFIYEVEVDLLIQTMVDLASPGDTWVFSGSLPQGMPCEIYADLISIVSKIGCKTVLDSSGDAFVRALHTAPTIIKPNRDEAEYATGFKGDDLNGLMMMGSAFLEKGIQWVAISCGEKGLFFACPSEYIFLPAPLVQVRSTVGAGDALLAGLVYAINRGYDIFSTAKWGVAAGTIAASLDGVNFGTLEQVSQMAQNIGNNYIHAKW